MENDPNSGELVLELIAPDRLRPHPKNPRLHPDSAISNLCKSIEKYGFTNPILVSKDGMIIAGHARWKAALRMGRKEVPIVRLPLQGAELDAYVIADNRLHYDTQWDTEKLKSMIEEFKGAQFDLTLTFFDKTQIDSISFGDDINPMAADPSGLGIGQMPEGGGGEDGEGGGGGDGLGGGENASAMMKGNRMMCPFCGSMLTVNEKGEVIHAEDPVPDEELAGGEYPDEENEPERGDGDE